MRFWLWPTKKRGNMAKILVIDDEEEVVNLYKDFLSKKGFNVLTATDGADGLSIAQKEIPDLILLDVMMPNMDGGEIAQNLLKRPSTRRIPVIFLTGIITQEEEAEAEKGIGKRFFLSKTSNIAEILQKIADVLGMRT